MKGTVDALYIPVTLLTLAILVVVGYYLLSELNANPLLNSATSEAVVHSWEAWDTAFVAATIFLCIAAIVLGYFIPTHPAFIVVEFILLILAVIIAPIYSNMYAQFATNPELNPSAAQFTGMNFIIGNMPIVALVISIGIALATYGKKFAGGAGGGVAGL